MAELPLIAVFAGPTATILNTPPLRTSTGEVGAGAGTGDEGRDALRAQRLAAPASVYVEHLSAHPLEADAAALYAPPDGYLDPDGRFHPAAGASPEPGWRAVLRVELRPDEGPLLLPYRSRQRDDTGWEASGLSAGAPEEEQRQTFYPDASRLYEEIDRFGVDASGRGRPLSSQARFRFFRANPPGGYRTTAPAPGKDPWNPAEGAAGEARGVDYFAYCPDHLHTEPGPAALARATNLVQETLATGGYLGAQWLEGSPSVEETLYWFNLVLDIEVPLAGHSAQRPHGTLSADGDRNVVDGVAYLTSKVWADEQGRDALGAVLVNDEMIYGSREVTKVAARPGGYAVAGGLGGVLGTVAGVGRPAVHFLPTRRHTWRSQLRLGELPARVAGSGGGLGGAHRVEVEVLTAGRRLQGAAMPAVVVLKEGRYSDGACGEALLDGWLAHALAGHPLAGIVAEGKNPYGIFDPVTDEALRTATAYGVPVVKCGRGNTAGFTPPTPRWAIAGGNLTASKARILLMAALLKLGALPPAADPLRPTPGEEDATAAAVAGYQALFDSH